MNKISLNKALRLKNRLVSKLERSRNIVRKFNSHFVQNEPNFNVVAELENCRKLSEQLVELKTVITKANTGIAKQLHRMDEIKSEISFLNGLDTREGEERNYEGVVDVYTATVRDVDVKEFVTTLEEEFESCQEEVNQYNFNTVIEISFTI